MNLRKFSVILLLLICISTMIWAKGSSDEDSIELVFRQNDPPGNVPGLVEAVEKFSEMDNGITIRMENVPWADAQVQYVREVQAGGGPDVAQIAFVWTADMGREGLLKNLSPLVERDPPGQGIEDFLATDLAIVDNKLYGLPWSVDTSAMAYRPDLFKKAGIGRFPETWEELYEVAKKLTMDTNGDGRIDQYGFYFPAGSGPDGAIWFLVNDYLWSNGKSFLVKNEIGEWEVGVTAEDVEEVIRYFNRFISTGVTPESLIGVTWEGDPKIVGGLARGETAIAHLRLISYRNAKDQAETPLEMAVLPSGSVGRATHLGGRTLGINPNTKYEEACWEFINYLTSMNTFSTYAQFPAQKSLLEEIQAQLPEDESAYAEQLTFGQTFKDYIESPANTNSMWAATNREIGAALAGEKTIEEASSDLVERMKELLIQGSK